MKLFRVVAVDRGNQLGRRAGAVAQTLQHLSFAQLAVVEVLLELGRSLPNGRPVSGKQDAGSELPHGSKGAEVVGQAALRRIDHARSPPQHGVSCEQQTELGLVEDRVVGRVSRGVDGVEPRLARSEHLAVGKWPFVTSRSEGEDGRPAGGGEGAGRGGVVRMMVCEEDEERLARFPQDLADVPFVGRPRIDHDGGGIADDPGVRPLERVRSGVGGQHATDPGHRSALGDPRWRRYGLRRPGGIRGETR